MHQHSGTIHRCSEEGELLGQSLFSNALQLARARRSPNKNHPFTVPTVLGLFWDSLIDDRLFRRQDGEHYVALDLSWSSAADALAQLRSERVKLAEGIGARAREWARPGRTFVSFFWCEDGASFSGLEGATAISIMMLTVDE